MANESAYDFYDTAAAAAAATILIKDHLIYQLSDSQLRNVTGCHRLISLFRDTQDIHFPTLNKTLISTSASTPACA